MRVNFTFKFSILFETMMSDYFVTTRGRSGEYNEMEVKLGLAANYK